jgi:hypothetical protein
VNLAASGPVISWLREVVDLPLDGHVTEDRVVHQVPEVPLRIAEVARDIHVVVN